MRSLKCLGTGTGSSNFFTGHPSSAYLLQTAGAENLLMDCGTGVGRALMSATGGALAHHIYVSHNHSDHTGDLPVYVATAQAQGSQPVNLYGHRDVLSIVEIHRLHELRTQGRSLAVTWHAEDGIVRLPECRLELELLRTGHSYLCYGFLARDLVSGDPILGWTADSPFDKGLYAKISEAPVVIAHCRTSQSDDHATFAEVEKFALTRPATQFYLSHYEAGASAPEAMNVTLLRGGMTLDLS